MSGLKRMVKHVLGWLLFHMGLHRMLLRDQATIVLFHRVDDRYPDNPISCTTAQFRAYCRFFSRHFRVVDLDELVERLEAGEGPPDGGLSITFDDGYRDNRTKAAPILESFGLPCTFFISIGLIESDRVPWWDAEQDISSEWMNWTQVAELARSGFGIGAHTVNHVDLGVVTGEEARQEISISKSTLERRLSMSVEHFSYPFGHADQFTEENREIVRNLGFRSCLSAFGGSVDPETDPHAMPRLAISPWYRSPYHLGWEILFGNR